jgi:hypothetical protein
MDVLEYKPPDKTKRHSGLRLSLRDLLQNANEHPEERLTLGRIVEATGESAFGVLMAFLCLPFLTPIPVPLVSIPFGIALFLLGLQVAISRHRPWLPAWMMRIRLPQKFTTRLIGFVAKVLGPLERIIHPRLGFMQSVPAMVLAGAALAIDGLVLAFLPPLPLSNAIPAWMAMVKILGITERDGGALLVGTILTFGAVAVVVVALVSGVKVFT